VRPGGRSRHPPRSRSSASIFFPTRRFFAIVDALAPGPNDTVVEIGRSRIAHDILAGRSKRVLRWRIDRALATLLRDRYYGPGKCRDHRGRFPEADLGAASATISCSRQRPVQHTNADRVQSAGVHAEASVFSFSARLRREWQPARTRRVTGRCRSRRRPVANVESSAHSTASAVSPTPKVESRGGETPPVPAAARAGRPIAAFALSSGSICLRRKQMQRVLRTAEGCPATGGRDARSAGSNKRRDQRCSVGKVCGAVRADLREYDRYWERPARPIKIPSASVFVVSPRPQLLSILGTAVLNPCRLN